METRGSTVTGLQYADEKVEEDSSEKGESKNTKEEGEIKDCLAEHVL
jgi:hypothetical protein